jgi:adenylate cyclase
LPDGERRLAAIMFTDIVGFTAMTQSSESLAMEVLERHNKLLRPFFPEFHGREVKAMGDSFLVEFESALDALTCAVEIQSYLHDYNVSSKDEWKIRLRIGVHLGDVIHREGDVFGDAVNVASRIEPIAEPEGVCLSEQVFDQVRNKFPLPLLKLEPRTLKNVQFPIDVYRVVLPWEQSTTAEVAAYPTNRIAILPFASFSPDPNDGFLADGITDEIISAVSGISGLSVISRTSVAGYKGTTKKVKEIGKELEVGSVLEGSFKKAGDRIRVTAQLIDVAGDRHIWAQSYDRKLDDVFAVQTDVASQVADALRVRILSHEMERISKKPTESSAAYTLYLKGRYLWSRRGVENIKKAAEFFEQAVKEDPSFALGYVGQADCCLVLENWGFDMEENQQKAKRMVAKALQLDPGLAEAHATRGNALKDDHDVQQAEDEFRKAIELKPSYATAHHWYFSLLLDQLRWDEALAQIEKALELDPLSPVINYNQGNFYYARRDYGRALEIFKRVIALDPGFTPVRVQISDTYGRLKMYDDMRREAAVAVELIEGPRDLVRKWADARIAYFEDDKQSLRRLLPELEASFQEGESSRRGGLAGLIAVCHFHLGEDDRGFEWLERAYLMREDLSGIKRDPDFDGVRTDPRYLDLLRRLGLD